MAPPSTDLILKTVVPAVGTVVCFFLYLAPARAVLAARRRGCLGDLNPIPMVSMLANAIGWTIYGVATSDLFIYLSNIVGVLLATPFVFSVFGFAGDRARSTITSLAFFYAGWMGIAGGVSAFAGLSAAHTEILWGVVTNLQLLIFYAAPLSTLAAVLQARDAATIAANWPMTAVSTVNAALWSAYGVAIGRPFVWAPNVAGFGLGAVQLGLCVCLPAGGKGSKRKGGKAARVEDEEAAGGAAGGTTPRLVAVALHVTPAGRAAGGGAKPAPAALGGSRRYQGALSASIARTLSFGQWGEVEGREGGGGGGASQGGGVGGWFARAGRRLSSSLLSGGSSRGGVGGGGSSRGLLSSSGRRAGEQRRAWFSSGEEAGGGGGGGPAAPRAPPVARAATVGDEEAPSAAPAPRAPPITRTATFGQFR